MPSDVRYRETLRMQSSTFRLLVGIFALPSVPLAALVWVVWTPLAAALVVGVMLALSSVFWLTRWQVQVRNDGLYYRVVPFYPVWRPIADASVVTDVTAEHDANGQETLHEEGALFPWSSGNRTVAMDIDGGVRIKRGAQNDVFVSSHSPDAFASALRAVAR